LHISASVAEEIVINDVAVLVFGEELDVFESILFGKCANCRTKLEMLYVNLVVNERIVAIGADIFDIANFLLVVDCKVLDFITTDLRLGENILQLQQL